jgi:signal peptidase I
MKKVLDVTTKVLTYLLTAFTIFMMAFTIITVTTVDKNERNVFGYRFYIVKTDSMSKSENNADLDVHFNAGDIIIVKNVEDKKALESGDIITFISTNDDSYFETITHMIRDKAYDKNGNFIGYITYGTNTGVNDEAPVEFGYILGKYTGKLPAVGQFFAFVKTTPGYIVCILVPFLLLILYNGVNVIRLFKQYRAEQMSAMQAERDKIDAERAENLRMMEELMALKEQLLKQQSAPAAPAEAPAEEPAEVASEPTPEAEPAEETSEEIAEEILEEIEESPLEEPEETLTEEVTEEETEETSESEIPTEEAPVEEIPEETEETSEE